MKIKLNNDNTARHRLARILLFIVYHSAKIAIVEQQLLGSTGKKNDSHTTEETLMTISATVIGMVCEDEVYNPHSEQQVGCS